MHNYHILAIDDNEALLQTLKLILKKEFAVVGPIQHPNLVPAILAGGKVDAILLDMNFDKGRLDCEEGLYWLNAIKERPNPPAIILMTATTMLSLVTTDYKSRLNESEQLKNLSICSSQTPTFLNV